MDAQFDRDTRREKIEREIASNPHRSNREIARLVGAVDHKLVGRVRGAMIKEKRDAPVNAPPDAPVNAPPDKIESLGHAPNAPPRSDDFSWCDVPDDAIVIEPRAMVAAYIHPGNGCLIIAQDRDLFYERDAVIHIPADHIADFVQHLVEIAQGAT